tara:strand:- start:10046 stop:10876 length:831 start_codon:yes stop_codon:yes gene_type:complete
MKKNKILNKIGFMQGRLSPIYKNKIQSFPWMHWRQELDKSKKLNINIIEWTLDHPNLLKNPIILNTDKTFKLIKKKKIKIESITCDFFMQKPFFKKNKYSQLFFLKKVISALYDKKIILVIPLVDNSSIKSKIEEKIVIKTFLNLYEKIIKFTNIMICFESDYGPKQLKKFISNFPVKNFGINYDTGNSANNGFDLSEEIESYKKRIINVHIKDRIYKGETKSLGTGDVDFIKLFQKMKKINYKGNYILQTARSKTNQHFNELNNNLKYILNASKI